MQLNPTLSRAQANLAIDQRRPGGDAEPPPGVHERRSQRMMQVAEGVELAHYNLGLAFRQKGYYAEAQREYQLALERGEDRALVLQAMAEVHLLRQDHEAAIALYDNLILESPDSPKLWNERGVAVHQDGRFARGRGELSQRARGRSALRDRAQQPRRRAVPRGRARARRSTRSAPRSTRTRRS